MIWLSAWFIGALVSYALVLIDGGSGRHLLAKHLEDWRTDREFAWICIGFSLLWPVGWPAFAAWWAVERDRAKHRRRWHLR